MSTLWPLGGKANKLLVWGMVGSYLTLDLCLEFLLPIRLGIGLVLSGLLLLHFATHWPTGGHRQYAFENYVLLVVFSFFQLQPLSSLLSTIPWALLMLITSLAGFFLLTYSLRDDSMGNTDQ